MPNPASSPVADVEQIYLPKFDALVTVNVADVPYLRATAGALTPAEYAAKQAAEAAAKQAVETAASTRETTPKPNGKPFVSKAEKDAKTDGEKTDGTASADAPTA